jgi:hypothetical protein
MCRCAIAIARVILQRFCQIATVEAIHYDNQYVTADPDFDTEDFGVYGVGFLPNDFLGAAFEIDVATSPYRI